ncbi:MAG: hypothetical protein KDD94_01835 [Calditrichaeota bacterium]|nr:hypothetical protein [Calditrichota bacterium]
MNLSQLFKRNQLLFLVTLLTGLFLVPQTLTAQHRSRAKRQKTSGRHISYLPRGFNHFVHGKQRFYHRRGLFYRKSGYGFALIRGPIGFRVKHLPIGFTSVYFSGHPYYYYYGTYYRFDPVNDDYIICNKPDEEDDDADFNHQSGLDEIQLSNGKIYHGKYLGGDSETIRIEIDGIEKKIPIKDIISIQYANPLDSEDDE